MVNLEIMNLKWHRYFGDVINTLEFI